MHAIRRVCLCLVTVASFVGQAIPLRSLATAPLSVPADPRSLIVTMIGRERSASEHKDRYEYLSKERSARTNGHLWTEHIIETSDGKIRLLLAEDGVPLSVERSRAERVRLAAIAADPEAFARREAAARADEGHARQMLELLPRGFLFEHPRVEGDMERIDYRPNPDFQPQTMEERVLHGMAGSMLVDVPATRLRELDGHLTADVSLGFGLLATVKAGSRFLIERQPVSGGEWKTTRVDMDVIGRAMFFKTISKNQQSEHGDYQRVPDDLSVAAAVAKLER